MRDQETDRYKLIWMTSAKCWEFGLHCLSFPAKVTHMSASQDGAENMVMRVYLDSKGMFVKLDIIPSLERNSVVSV